MPRLEPGITGERTDPDDLVAPAAERARRRTERTRIASLKTIGADHDDSTSQHASRTPGPDQRVDARPDAGTSIPVDDPRGRLCERRVRIPSVERARQTAQSRPEREHLNPTSFGAATAPSRRDGEPQHRASNRRHGARHVEHEDQRTRTTAAVAQDRIEQLSAPSERSLEAASEIELAPRTGTETPTGPLRGRDPKRADGPVDSCTLIVGRTVEASVPESLDIHRSPSGHKLLLGLIGQRLLEGLSGDVNRDVDALPAILRSLDLLLHLVRAEPDQQRRDDGVVHAQRLGIVHEGEASDRHPRPRVASFDVGIRQRTCTGDGLPRDDGDTVRP